MKRTHTRALPWVLGFSRGILPGRDGWTWNRTCRGDLSAMPGALFYRTVCPEQEGH